METTVLVDLSVETPVLKAVETPVLGVVETPVLGVLETPVLGAVEAKEQWRQQSWWTYHWRHQS